MKSFVDPHSRPQSVTDARPTPEQFLDSARSRVTTRALAVGVLALQGSVEPHRKTVAALGHEGIPVRLPEQLRTLTHLILPGGESTTLYKLMRKFELWEAIRTRAASGSLAIFGTCAGAILLGRASSEYPPRMELLDVDVERNAYGRQVDSFVAPLELAAPIGAVSGVFIRAPRLQNPGPSVEVLGESDGFPILVKQDRLLAATFHPELTDSPAIHELFLTL